MGLDGIAKFENRDLNPQNFKPEMSVQIDTVNVSNESSVSDSPDKENNLEQRDKMLHNIERLAEVKWIDGFELFEGVVLGLNDSQQSNIFAKDNFKSLVNSILTAERFPVDEFELSQSLTWQLIDLNSKASLQDSSLSSSNIVNDVLDLTSEVESMANLGAELSQLSLSNYHLLELLDQFQSFWNIQDITNNKLEDQILSCVKEIINVLSTTDLVQREILPQAKAAGGETYQRVRTSLISLWSPEIKRMVLSFEQTPPVDELPSEQRIRTSSALDGVPVNELSKEAEQSGSLFTIDIEDGMEIQYDVMSDERLVGLDGYKINSSVEDAWDYQTPKLKYARVEQANQPQIDTIMAISKVMDERELDVDDLAEIKAVIRTIPGHDNLGIDFTALDSGEEIKKALHSTLLKHQVAIREARQEYSRELFLLRTKQLKLAEEKDIKVKKTLLFLRDVWLTQMPQSVFQQVVETVNIDPVAYGFETQINLEEGILWFNSLWDNDNTDRVRFAQMVNVMLWVSPESEFAVDADAVNGIWNTAISNRTKFNIFVAQNSWWTNLTASATILERLKQGDNQAAKAEDEIDSLLWESENGVRISSREEKRIAA